MRVKAGNLEAKMKHPVLTSLSLCTLAFLATPPLVAVAHGIESSSATDQSANVQNDAGIVTGSSIDIMALVADTQKVSTNQEVMDLVWWLPIEFWQATAAQEPSMTDKDLRELEDVLSPYTIVAVAFGNIGPFGGIKWLDRDDLRQKLALVDADGNEYAPYTSENVSPDANNLVAVLSAYFASVLGPIGDNLNFFFFSANGVSGERIADASQEGSFSVRLASETYEWDLPLGSVLPPKKCPVDDEPMPGNWQYCPFHGRKLVTGLSSSQSQ